MDDPSCSMEISTEVTTTTSKISFGLKRKEEVKITVVSKEIINVASDSEEEREKEEQERQAKRRKLTHFDSETALDDDDPKKKNFVIPIVVENDWRVAKLLEKQKEGTLTEEEEAKIALLTQSHETSDEHATENDGKVIVSSESKEDAPDADYSVVPIESFGLAILRGCNWKDGEGIGKNPQVVPLRIPARRPHGLGLGATPKVTQTKNGKKGEEGASLEVKKDSLVKIVDGRSKGLYGKVEARDDDANSLFVRLALGGKTVKVSVYSAMAVTQKEYERDAKCINKDSYDREKEIIERREKEKDSSRRHDENRLWARSDLVVRFIDKSYKGGKLYNQKLRVVDVAGRKDVTLEDDSGRTHYNIRQSWIETVVPRNVGDPLMILSGSRKGRTAILVEKDKRKQRVYAQLPSSNEVLKLDFEDVCLFRAKEDADYD
ncbi:unnamed protein product [Caenorhabditis auriculariae]|uniref:G-patch domain-containing protein n=1 Tax=Caenorhabditis auriculariae TaxID=2777116 RepID=A0A8S1HV04_9PELO|nr:unnamed protein product [Caenorhabditis auriculariae]